MKRLLLRALGKPARESVGFTLIELLVVTIVVGILAVIAAPSWVGFRDRQQLNSAVNEVQLQIRRAQEEAKRRQQPYQLSLRRDNDLAATFFLVHPQVIRDNDGNVIFDSTEFDPSDPDASGNCAPGLTSNAADVFGGYTRLIDLEVARAANSPDSQLLNCGGGNGSTNLIVKFDSNGNVSDPGSIGGRIIFGLTTGNGTSNADITDTRRCLTLGTLLGNVQVGFNGDC